MSALRRLSNESSVRRMLFHRLVLHGFLVVLICTVTHQKEFKLGLLIPYKTVAQFSGGNYFKGENFAAAMTLAVRYVNAQPNLLPGHNISFTWLDTNCNELRTITHQFELINEKISAIIGPGCYCKTAARNAAAFNLPIISYMCSNAVLSNKNLYPTFMRTFAVDSKVSPSIIALLNTFNWDRVAILYENLSKWKDLKDFLKNQFKKNNIYVAYEEEVPQVIDMTSIPKLPKYERELADKMNAIKKKARIVLFISSFNMARELIYIASKEGLANGDYVLIALELNHLYIKKKKRFPDLWYLSLVPREDKADKEFDVIFKRGLKAVLLLVVKSASGNREYQQFETELKSTTKLPPFNSSAYVDKKNNLVPMQGAFLYDAVVQYAIALNKTLMRNETPTGHAIFDKMKDRTYHSIQGFQVHMDKNGDAEFNISVLAYRKGTFGEKELIETADFQLLNKNETKVKLVFRSNAPFVWADGSTTPPKDEPKCGFDGKLCPDDTKKKDDNITIIAAVSGALAFLVLLFIANFYRHYKAERELQSRFWKIDYNDLCFEHRRGSNTSLASAIIHHRDPEDEAGIPLLEDDTGEGKTTTIGNYKGNMVTVAKLPTRSIDLTRKVLLELKQMRDIRHDNLNQFIGACAEPPIVCVVMQYCSRGSLQDILENPDVKLDHMFIASLVADIVKGMAYLHSSDIHSHGNLKSSNCLVDSRWVLKITDYGLPTFRAKVKKPTDNYAHYRDQLWVAPELLRSPNREIRGTQKGDVYSFAIILHEFHTREGPYSNTELEPKEIVHRVKEREYPPFRPTVTKLIGGVEELKELMVQCWEEDHETRPDFHDIKKIVHKLLIQNGMKTNIFDNIVYMMEKYADNLEELVMERTGQLIEEKKKTDALLERMLPPSVAEQLKKGKAVEAESFNEVSIYFSDIVGFTSLSAESTPMQVVALLNDLYTLFDDIIREYDVYKVETIGDAYMVVSGLPIRNGSRHAGEIARMSLHLVDAVQNVFTVRHKPGYKLKLRVGIHSGPVVAGVVGNTMPRYCLFGDTVNTSSRMESNGEPLRIHISSQTKEFLDRLGGFIVEERGEVFLKGKGNCVTYWLIDAAKRRHCGSFKEKSLHPNGNPYLSYLTAPGQFGSTGSLNVRRTESFRKTIKGTPSPKAKKKVWHKFDVEDGSVPDGHTAV